MKKEVVQKFYNKMYRSGKTKKMNNFLRHFEKYRDDIVFELLDKGKRLLDVACGDGELVILARSKFEETYGIDVSSVRIKRAKEKLKKFKLKSIFFKTCDVNQGLPFKDEFFDAVSAVAALAFFFDPYFVISEFNRILKKRGTLIIQVPNIAFLPRRLSLFFGKLPKVAACDKGWDGGHLHYFTGSSLKKLLESSGFKVIKTTGSGIFANLRSWWPSLLCGDIIIKAVKK